MYPYLKMLLWDPSFRDALDADPSRKRHAARTRFDNISWKMCLSHDRAGLPLAPVPHQNAAQDGTVSLTLLCVHRPVRTADLI
jgi:hypothetical protein